MEKEGDETPYTAQERIQDILHYLEENMDRMISRREAAKYVFLNEDYFSRMFRKEMGIGYKEYVLKQKMDYAGRLLENTDLSVTLVASKVGYDNFTNFTQMFRKYTGETPSDYRKRTRKTGGGKNGMRLGSGDAESRMLYRISANGVTILILDGLWTDLWKSGRSRHDSYGQCIA